MKNYITIFLFSLFMMVPINFVHAQELSFFTNSQVYSDGQPLSVSGIGIPGENLIIRLFTPDGTIAKFDQVTTSVDDGSFNQILLVWPTSSTTFPYGTYTVEIISTEQNGFSTSLDVKFTSSSDLVGVPIDRQINTLVFAPETAAIDVPLRVFVQTTSDGLLIGGNPEELLSTTHVHLPSGEVQTLSTSFETLHQGLYFVDYTPNQLGIYVFHVVTFHQGTVSHGSAATNILSQDISGISEQILKLNSILDDTSEELDSLKSEVGIFSNTLEKASTTIDSSVGSMSSSVTNIEEASIQLNSLLFPIVAFIAITVALQVVIIARRR